MANTEGPPASPGLDTQDSKLRSNRSSGASTHDVMRECYTSRSWSMENVSAAASSSLSFRRCPPPSMESRGGRRWRRMGARRRRGASALWDCISSVEPRYVHKASFSCRKRKRRSHGTACVVLHRGIVECAAHRRFSSSYGASSHHFCASIQSIPGNGSFVRAGHSARAMAQPPIERPRAGARPPATASWEHEHFCYVVGWRCRRWMMPMVSSNVSCVI